MIVLEPNLSNLSVLPQNPYRGESMQLYRIRDLTSLLGVSRSTIYRMVDRGTLPPPIHISSRSPRWTAAVIEQWIDARR